MIIIATQQLTKAEKNTIDFKKRLEQMNQVTPQIEALNQTKNTMSAFDYEGKLFEDLSDVLDRITQKSNTIMESSNLRANLTDEYIKEIQKDCVEGEIIQKDWKLEQEKLEEILKQEETTFNNVFSRLYETCCKRHKKSKFN